jgi:hypothetical protein
MEKEKRVKKSKQARHSEISQAINRNREKFQIISPGREVSKKPAKQEGTSEKETHLKSKNRSARYVKKKPRKEIML